MLDTIFFNFNYNMRLAEHTLNSNRKCLQVSRGHNSCKSSFVLFIEKNTSSIVSFASPLSPLSQVDFVLFAIFAMETNTGTVLGTQNQTNMPVCSLHMLTVRFQSEKKNTKAFQCTDCKGTGVGQTSLGFFFVFLLNAYYVQGTVGNYNFVLKIHPFFVYNKLKGKFKRLKTSLSSSFFLVTMDPFNTFSWLITSSLSPG